jgi:hypothetical protein
VVDQTVFSATRLYRVTHTIGQQGADNLRGSERLASPLSVDVSRRLLRPRSIMAIEMGRIILAWAISSQSFRQSDICVLHRRFGNHGGAAIVLSGPRFVNAWRQAEGSNLSPVGRWTGVLGFPKHAREDIQTPMHRTSQAISSSLKNPDLSVEPLDKTSFHAPSGQGSAQFPNHRSILQ